MSESAPGRVVPPTGLCVLTTLGGALVFFQGFYLWLSGAPASGGPSVLGPSIETGPPEMILGVLLFGLAFGLLASPRNHTGIGIASITVALLSLFAGGGFVVGALVAYAGGVLSVIYVPTRVPRSETRSTSDREDDSEEFDDPVAEAELVDAGLLPADPPVDEPSDGAAPPRSKGIV